MKAEHEFPSPEEYKKYLRIYFAGLAMQGLMASNETKILILNEFIREKKQDRSFADVSLGIADSVLKSLEQ